eukprot:15350-Heterococcus_DN1.PRE.2
MKCSAVETVLTCMHITTNHQEQEHNDRNRNQHSSHFTCTNTCNNSRSGAELSDTQKRSIYAMTR